MSSAFDKAWRKEYQRKYMREYMRQRRSSVPRFTCPRCFRVSYNPNDIRERYCGACHQWADAP